VKKITRDELAQQVREVVCENLGVKPEQVTDEATLTVDLGADELDRVELVIEMEERYGIEIDTESGESADTFGKLVDVVYSELRKGWQQDGH
jgi:acyl carrier protein